MIPQSSIDYFAVFDRVDKRKWFSDVTMGCLPNLDEKYTSTVWPPKWTALDLDCNLQPKWRKIGGNQRAEIYSSVGASEDRDPIYLKNLISKMLDKFTETGE